MEVTGNSQANSTHNSFTAVPLALATSIDVHFAKPFLLHVLNVACYFTNIQITSIRNICSCEQVC